MMQVSRYKRQLLNTQHYFDSNFSKLYIFTLDRIKVLTLPICYIYSSAARLSICGANKTLMKLFLRSLYRMFSDVYFFKLKIRGLGYR